MSSDVDLVIDSLIVEWVVVGDVLVSGLVSSDAGSMRVELLVFNDSLVCELLASDTGPIAEEVVVGNVLE